MEQAPRDNFQNSDQQITREKSPQSNLPLREDELEEEESFENETMHELDSSMDHYEAPELEEIGSSSSMLTPLMPVREPEKRPLDSIVLQADSLIPVPKYASMMQFTEEFWKDKKRKMLNVSEAEMMGKTKNMSVPMARVKKIMRIDDDVRSLMISSDAPLFMAQACEFFIEEMTGMGWQYVSESRRRILQKTDIAAAVQKSDQFDFLIDFLPPRAREGQTSVKQALTHPEHPSSSYNALKAATASIQSMPFHVKNTPMPLPPRMSTKPLPERTPRPYGMPRDEKKLSKWQMMHAQMESEKQRRLQEAPTDPASISLGCQQSSAPSGSSPSKNHNSEESQ